MSTKLGKSRKDLWRKLLGEPTALAYDFDARVGTLRIVDGQWCDMTGCIALFQRIDPAVICIETFSGEKRDTTYVLQANGEWIALAPPEFGGGEC